MDEQILPSVSKFLGCSFRAAPHQLGQITFWRALVQALASPLGGLAGHRYNRVFVLSAGAFIWAAFTAGFAFSRDIVQGMTLWAFNGIGLSLMIPNAQSLIADYYPDTQRGAAFGTLMMTGETQTCFSLRQRHGDAYMDTRSDTRFQMRVPTV